MRRDVSAHLDLSVAEPALVAVQIAVAATPADESLTAVRDGAELPLREVAATHGGRIHVLDATPGPVRIDYSATVVGPVEQPPTGELDLLAYRRPSRYCPSDKLLAWVDDGWRVVDATGLAPRRSMLRIGTGRDAADTAFMSVHGGIVDLTGIEVLAVVDDLPSDDGTEVVTLS
jgi:hypothetical protein